MADIIERLRIESRREPHEPIWRDAIEEIEHLRAEVELWRHKAAVHQYRRKRLAEALEACLEAEERPKIRELARAALAAHRKGGDV